MTKKHHWAYLGKWVMLCLCLIGLLYSVCVYHVITLSWQGSDVNVPLFVTGATVMATIVGAVVALLGVLTAHRIAGVHIKLRNTFDAIAEGDTELRLRFRNYDKLEEVEKSFNAMMDVLTKDRD